MCQKEEEESDVEWGFDFIDRANELFTDLSSSLSASIRASMSRYRGERSWLSNGVWYLCDWANCLSFITDVEIISGTFTFCLFSAPTAQRPEETQEKGTRSLARVETDFWMDRNVWLGRVWGSRLFAPPSPQIAAVDEDGREDKATIKCETSPPPTPRTVRMTHTLPASSHNDARG